MVGFNAANKAIFTEMFRLSAVARSAAAEGLCMGLTIAVDLNHKQCQCTSAHVMLQVLRNTSDLTICKKWQIMIMTIIEYNQIE